MKRAIVPGSVVPIDGLDSSADNPTMTNTPRRTRKVAVVVSINLVVAALHFVNPPDDSGPWRHFVTGYLTAITVPFAAYFLLALNDETIRFLRPWFVKAGIVFTVISSAEVAQYFGKPIFGETYDPWDFVAYAVGALLAAVADRILFPHIFRFWAVT